MPPPLPARYPLEVRLGRDGDIELWLATDSSLDRPVEIRFVGPDAGEERRQAFLASVRDAAAVSHPHFTSVYTAGAVPGGVYAISEWTGAISVADRVAAGETIPVDDFLPNAAGLADALAALHQEGIVHGAIDTTCLFHNVSHAAKLGGVGRTPQSHTAIDDVRALASALEEGLTGRPPGGPPPSEMVDGLSPSVDRVLRLARDGALTARAFANELAAAPTPITPPPEPARFSRRLLLAAFTLAVAAVGLVFVGRLLLADAGSPILVPASPRPVPTPAVETTTTTTPSATGSVAVTVPAPLPISRISSLDPFGEDEENDERLSNLTDGDSSTVWRTERYQDPLQRLKPGVGLVLGADGTPGFLELSGVTVGVSYQVLWSETAPGDPTGLESVVSGITRRQNVSTQLPARDGGWWILWFTDLPEAADGGRMAEIAEVRFFG